MMTSTATSASATSSGSFARRRQTIYVLTIVLLFTGYLSARHSTWQGNIELHTLMEEAATLLALNVGVLALIRFYSQKDNTFLFIGSGFLGTGFLDGYHAVVTSSHFASAFPSPPPSLVPWSWLASRLFLSLALSLSWWFWKREVRLGKAGAIDERLIYVIFAALTLGCFLFFVLVPLPSGYQPSLFFPRPQEFVPAALFAVALVGYWRKGRWRHDSFEHWLILALIVSFMGQAMFMSTSNRLYDQMFDLAHLLKKASYICVLVGLLINIYLLFLLSSKEALIVEDIATGSFVDVNERACGIFGYTRDEMLKLDLRALSAGGPRHSPSDLTALLRDAASGATPAFDWPCRTKDGRVVWIELSTRRPSFGSGEHLFMMVRDITERERAAEAVRQSEARFKAIFDTARDGITLADPETKQFVMGNDSFCRMVGYGPDELASLKIDSIHPAEARPIVIQHFERLARGEPGVAPELPVQRKDGSVFFVDISAAPVMLGDKRYLLGIFRDVSERKEAEEAIRQSEERYRNLVESTTDYMWETDKDGRYTYYSPAVKTLLGYEPREIMGKTPFNIMPPAEAQRVANIFAPIAAAHRPFSMIENTVLSKDGAEVVMETSGVPVFDKKGAYRGYRGIERDITQRKRTELALRERDALLHAVTASATEMVTAPSLDDAIRKALAMVSETLHIDRMNVLEKPPARGGALNLRYAWHAPDIQIAMSAAHLEDPALMSPQIAEWLAPLSEGKIVTANLSSATGGFKNSLESLGIKSMLVVPVFVDGKHWGQVGFDSCKQARAWRDFEVEILKTLADLIGNAIQRDRYVKELSDANRIVQNTPTILYRMRGEPALPMIYVSQNIKLFGYEPAALTASPELYKSLIHPDDLPRFHDWMSHVLEDRDQRSGVGELRMLTSRGDYRCFEDRFTPIRDSAGKIIEIEGLLIDITERKAAEERIALLARTDPLTGLANRTTFIERLRQLFAAARRGAPRFAVLYLDLDRFKDVNDTLGHPVGDRLLIMVSERLKSDIRDTDLVARFGGDEFSVLQTDVEDTTDAGALASKLRSALAEPMHIGGNELRITASIGISVYAPDTAAPEDLLAHADVALYRAKEEGRDQYRFHTKELDVQVREEVDLADELRMALERGEFKLYYQPQVELDTGLIVGMESLIRWDHPTRGMLSPSKFIPIAERTGTITAIGQWVLDRACQQMRQWQDAGIAPQTIAVNLSSVQIKTGNEFVQFVTDTLAKWRLLPANLELDVTESMLARAALAQSDVIERLQALGINISIDDFGTKYSSLDYLRTYRVNRLKIPKLLIDAATSSSEGAAVVRAIAGIARELNIEVIAQGVETKDQWSYLTAASPVSKVQGYYYSEPVPPDRAEQLLKRRELAPEDGRREVAQHPTTP